MLELLQEEQENLLAEVNAKIKKKKAYMNQDEPETGFQNFKSK